MILTLTELGLTVKNKKNGMVIIVFMMLIMIMTTMMMVTMRMKTVCDVFNKSRKNVKVVMIDYVDRVGYCTK